MGTVGRKVTLEGGQRLGLQRADEERRNQREKTGRGKGEGRGKDDNRGG